MKKIKKTVEMHYRHDSPLFIEAFAGKNCAYHVGRVNNGDLLQN